MSRIGKLPVAIPQGVRVNLEGTLVRVEGPKGKLESRVDPSVTVERADDRLVVRRRDDSPRSRGIHGLTRRLLANMISGVSRGFSKVLEINGVGYRAEVKGNAIHFSLGYSHPILFQLPPGIHAKVEKQTIVTLEGVDRQLLGATAAMIRELRPPEPYKGKGIKYAEEAIRRKAGKAATSAGA